MTIEATTPAHRYMVLDSLRGVCACMIVLVHFITEGHISALRVVRHGYLFVDFFFVLSGFVIGSSYGTRLTEGFSIGRFMALRLGRIYPLHLVVLLALLAFELFYAFGVPGFSHGEPFAGIFSPAAFVQSLFLVQIFFGPDATPWNGPSWSIAAEIWTYLIFALILRFARPALVPIAILIAILGSIYLANLTWRYMNVRHDGALVRCMMGFGLGMIGWRLASVAQSISLPRIADHLIEIMTVIATVALVWVAGSGPLSLGAPFLFFAAVLIFSRERGIVSDVLKRAPFILLGTLSYSIYMIHGFLYGRLLDSLTVISQSTGHDLLLTRDGLIIIAGSRLFGDAMTILFLGIVFGASYLSYHYVEKPGQDWSRRKFGKRTDQPVAQPAAALFRPEATDPV